MLYRVRVLMRSRVSQPGDRSCSIVWWHSSRYFSICCQILQGEQTVAGWVMSFSLCRHLTSLTSLTSLMLCRWYQCCSWQFDPLLQSLPVLGCAQTMLTRHLLLHCDVWVSLYSCTCRQRLFSYVSGAWCSKLRVSQSFGLSCHLYMYMYMYMYMYIYIYILVRDMGVHVHGNAIQVKLNVLHYL